MPNIFLTGNLGIFDNIVGNQLFDGGGLTYGGARLGDTACESQATPNSLCLSLYSMRLDERLKSG